MVLGARRGHRLQAADLALADLGGLGRRRRLLEPHHQLFVLFVGRSLVAELVPDGAHLVTQVLLLLAFLELIPDASLDLLLDAASLQLALESERQELEALAGALGRGDVALDGERQVQIRGDQIGEAAGAAHVHPEDALQVLGVRPVARHVLADQVEDLQDPAVRLARVRHVVRQPLHAHVRIAVEMPE